MRVDEVVRSAIDRAGVIRVRNAMNPLLWLSPISATISWIAAYMFRDDAVLKYAFACLGALPILASIRARSTVEVSERSQGRSVRPSPRN